ncbi:MAG: DUF4296 domain-containing protein [Lutibacter sp.]|nr:DUF4296 domain-containing protein [Lutibacter sp.]
MNKNIYIVILSVFLYACTSNTIIKKPNDLIPKEQMVDLLTDMFLAKGGDNIKNTNLQRNVNYFPFVFEKHKIDTVRFKESNYYYISRIDDYDEILGKVDERLKALKKQYDDENKLNDSLARLKKESIKMLRIRALKGKPIEFLLPKYKKHSTEKDFFDYLNSSNYYIQNNLKPIR